jgi:hypothetical protein
MRLSLSSPTDVEFEPVPGRMDAARNNLDYPRVYRAKVSLAVVD